MAQQTPKDPHVSKEIMEFLERTFPDHLPDETTSEREFMRLIGEQKVIRRLRRIYTSQNVLTT